MQSDPAATTELIAIVEVASNMQLLCARVLLDRHTFSRDKQNTLRVRCRLNRHETYANSTLIKAGWRSAQLQAHIAKQCSECPALDRHINAGWHSAQLQENKRYILVHLQNVPYRPQWQGTCAQPVVVHIGRKGKYRATQKGSLW